MGGSLALALRPHIQHLTLVDHDPSTLENAAPLADTVTTDFAAGVRECDLVILATPVRVILDLLPRLPQARPQGCFVLDMGSTKQAIGAAMNQLPPTFATLGGHPMCGKTQGGFLAADPDLYRGRIFVLCPTEHTTPDLLAIAQQLVAWIGGRPILLPAEAHDAIVAATSHLPYLVAANLMGVVAAAAASNPSVYPVSANGLWDSTRLAASDPAMMLDILLTNQTEVVPRLDEAIAGLQQVRQLLTEQDAAALHHWLRQRQQERQTYTESRHALDHLSS